MTIKFEELIQWKKQIRVFHRRSILNKTMHFLSKKNFFINMIWNTIEMILVTLILSCPFYPFHERILKKVLKKLWFPPPLS